MSAIWGAVNLIGKKIRKEDINVFKQCYKKCILDRIEEVINPSIYMACGIQYFTKEAINEKLPINSNKDYFTADVVLDNRNDLLAELKSQGKSYEGEPDGTIMYQFFSQDGEESLQKFLGAFTFAYYDVYKNEVFLVSDVVGNRYVYYLIQDNTLFFSSLMKPLEQIQRNKKINERWISDFLTYDTLIMYTESEETTLCGINRVAPGQCIRISMEGIVKKTYRTPFKHKRLCLKTDEEYKERFLNVYKECVSCLLRSSEETAIFLSGGYDSSSVAALAAPELEKRGKALFSFTTVPCRKFDIKNTSQEWVDESETVLKIKELYLNIEPTFFDLEDMEPWKSRKWYMDIAETPYKSPENVLWLYKGSKLAYQRNCRIMLGGMLGNDTVSYGDPLLYMVTLIQTGKFLKLYHEIQIFHNKTNRSRKKVLHSVIRRGLLHPYGDFNAGQMFDKSYAASDYRRRNNSEKRISKIIREMNYSMFHYKKMRMFSLSTERFRVMSELRQKNSLYTGVLVRDPTMDIRMIEFMLQVPIEQFSKDGQNRRFISEYMKDMIPKEVLQEKRRGIQSSDLLLFLQDKEEQIKKEWLDIYSREQSVERVDCVKASSDLIPKNFKEMKRFDIIRHFYTCLILEYLEDKKI